MGSVRDETGAKSKPRRRPFLESARVLTYTLVASIVIALIALLPAQFTAPQAMLLHVAFVSLVTLLVFGIDKLRAGRGKRRASEFNLFALATLGGAAGGLLGIALFRHKAQRATFTVGLTVLVFVHGVLLAVVWLR